MMPILTIFTAPKPFKDPHIRVIQYNAIRSWVELGAEVAVGLIGEEEGLAEAASDLGVGYYPEVKRNVQGTPLISSIFELGRNINDSPLLAYVNADIILLPDFLEAARLAASQEKRFLLVGQRWDLDVPNLLDFSAGWQERLLEQCKKEGRLHPRGGSDYFIYPRAVFRQIPDFAVGRAGWDNWMFYQARKENWKTIDATDAIQIIHQDHDYAHLPQGQSHYRLPETSENVRLAGGPRTIFTLLDSNYLLRDRKIRRYPLDWKKLWREIEIFPLIKLKSIRLGQLFYGITHPRRAWVEFRSSHKKKA